MIRTKEEMHHSTGNVPSCPAHPAFTAGRCLGVRVSGKENGSGLVSVQVSASLHRKPQSSRPSALGAAGTCKPGGNKDLLRCQRERVSLEPNAPFPGRDLRICLEGEGYTGAVQGSGGGHGDPRLRHPDRRSSGKPQR